MKKETVLGIYVLLYFLVNLSILTDFPFVHSDEAWLSGLTRNMMESGNLGVTETFFDLKPRYPHGIKSLFHLLQMPMLALFGYQVFSFRLLSLIFGCLSLMAFYFLLKYILGRGDGTSAWYPLLGTVLLSLDIQFIYAAHFARQEILLIFAMLLVIYALSRGSYTAAALVTGLSIGLHPNSFLLGTMAATILLSVGRPRWKPFLTYSGITGAFALAFVLLSLSFDKHFFPHYLAYGNSEFDIGASPANKLAELPTFFLKIWHGVSGTYYVPQIRLQLLLFAITFVAALIYLMAGKARNKDGIVCCIKGLAGILLGMVLIGRYNQTSILFLFPLCYLLLLLIIEGFLGPANIFGSVNDRKNMTIGVLALVVGALSIYQIAPWLSYSYDDYLREIAKAVKPENKVLANLNSEYYFENGKLLDVRNLTYLKENKMSIGDYIKANEIEYILLSGEMDFIYSQRPVWNILYGNPRYMEELRDFVEQQCTLAHEFTDNTYAIRIPMYINSGRDFAVQIYKVKE